MNSFHSIIMAEDNEEEDDDNKEDEEEDDDNKEDEEEDDENKEDDGEDNENKEDEEEDNENKEDEEDNENKEDDENKENENGEEDDEQFEQGYDTFDPENYYIETPKKIPKAIFNRRRRLKIPKVSKNTKKRIKNQEKELVIQNYMMSDLRINALSNIKNTQSKENKSNEKECKLIERLIFNHVVRKLELLKNRKIKKSELDSELFRSSYTEVVYETIISLMSKDLDGKEKVDIKDQIKILKEDQIGLYSFSFKDEKFMDEQETKNIKEPPTAKPGIHKCNKCFHDKNRLKDKDRGRRTWCYELQTRSSDEPMTIFVTCLDCGKRWTC
jgi:hypothetical protein